MEIILSLKKHCIETAAKKSYEQLIQSYFKNKGDDPSVLEARIDALKFFIERADFARLRTDYPELSGNVQLPITLSIPEEFESMEIVMKDKRIQPEWKEK